MKSVVQCSDAVRSHYSRGRGGARGVLTRLMPSERRCLSVTFCKLRVCLSFALRESLCYRMSWLVICVACFSVTRFYICLGFMSFTFWFSSSLASLEWALQAVEYGPTLVPWGSYRCTAVVSVPSFVLFESSLWLEFIGNLAGYWVVQLLSFNGGSRSV